MDLQPKILIVDDKPANLYALERVLKNINAKVIKAENGNDALISTLNNDFSLAILDVQMPEMDGYELAEYIRSEERTKYLPIIFLSAVYSDDYHVFKGYQSGAIDFITKPFNPQILINKVELFLQMHHQKKELELSKQELQNTVEKLKISNEQYQGIFQAVTECLFIINRNNKIVEVNTSACKKYGYTYSEFTGYHIKSIFHTDYQHVVPEFRDQLSHKKVFYVESKHVKKDGSAFYVEIRGTNFNYKGKPHILAVVSDTSQRVKTLQQLKKSELKYKNIFEIATVSLWEEDISAVKEYLRQWDVNNSEQLKHLLKEHPEKLPEILQRIKILNVNSESLRLYKAKSKEELINSFDKILSKEAHYAMIASLNAILDGEKSFEIETTQYTLTGEKLHVILRWKIPPEDYQFQNILISIVDITELKHIENEINAARKAAEQASIAKTEFLTNISHEIRTPLNAILGFAEILREKHHQTEQIRNYINGIVDSGKNLLLLINDILDLSKIESGKIEINFTPTDIRNLINEVKQIFAIKLSEKNLKFNIKYTDDVPGILNIDEIRLRQVLFNLVGNAVKFTHKGKIEIRLKVNPLSNKNPDQKKKNVDLIIEVEDTGIGIPEQNHDIIFHPFKQQDGCNSRKYGGTGLGLAITKRLVEMMNGEISLKSRINKGSVFTVKLQNIGVISKEHSIESTDIEENNIIFNTAHVLLIEESGTNTLYHTFDKCLKEQPIVLHHATDISEAFHVIEKHRTQVVIIDFPKLISNDYQFLSELRNHPRNELQSIPVVVAINPDDSEIAAQYQKKIEKHVYKPITKKQCYATLTTYISYRKKQSDDIRTVQRQNTNYINNLINNMPKSNEIDDELIRLFQNDLIPMHQNTIKSLSLNKIKAFANKISEAGDNYNIPTLKQLGNKLYENATQFKFDDIMLILKEFQKIIDLVTGNRNMPPDNKKTNRK